MTIKRQYNLPNCTLSLEGLSSTLASGDALQTARATLDILIRCECFIVGQTQPLVGGRDFLESLAKAASLCAQEWLSGVSRPHRSSHHDTPAVECQPSGFDSFYLVVPRSLLLSEVSVINARVNESASADSPREDAPPVEMHLTAVQLFDLVEAIDQLLADAQTLPDLGVNVSPISHREAVASQPLAKRAAPVALGATSLALAAAALFVLPVPQVRRPELKPPATEETTPQTQQSPGLPGPDAEPTPPTPLE